MTDSLAGVASSYGTTPGRTFHAQVAPLRREPRLRWSVAADAHQVYCNGQHVATKGSRMQVLDLATGEPLPAFKKLPRPGGGYPLLTRDLLAFDTDAGGVLCVELATGKKSGPHVLGEQAGMDLLPGLALWSQGKKSVAWSLEAGQEPKQLWEYEDPERGFNGVYRVGDLVLGSIRLGGTVALDAKTGAVRWRSEDQVTMADAAGTAAVGRGAGYGMLDASGARAWWRNDPRWAVRALGPTWLVTEQSGGFEHGARSTVRLHDRATGKELRTLGTVGDSQLICTAASDVLYAVDGKTKIVAWDLEGKELWRCRVPRSTADINYLAACEGVLLGVTSAGRVFCLSDD